MAAKARAGKLENTIETCRSEGKWQKSIELAEELKSSSPTHGKINVINKNNYLKIKISRNSIKFLNWRGKT